VRRGEAVAVCTVIRVKTRRRVDLQHLIIAAILMTKGGIESNLSESGLAKNT
jgi:hypothetical protein